MTGKYTLALLCVFVLALASFAAANPQPFDLKKTVKNAINKVKDYVSPTINCLKKAGAGDAVLGWLKECGQTKYFGKTAMITCAGTTYAPADVKQLAKDSAHCFKQS